MTHARLAMRVVFGALATAGLMACASLDATSSLAGEGAEGPNAGADAGGLGSAAPGDDRSPGAPTANGIVLVHAAAFPSFRVCFENYPELRPMPDSDLMPNANVVGVEIGSAVRIDPLERAPGKVYVIDRTVVQATVGGADDPTCGERICASGTKCLRPGPDYQELAPLTDPVGVGKVDIVALTGCANSTLLGLVGVDSATCGDDWTPAGNLATRVLSIQPSAAATPTSLPVQLFHFSPQLDSQRGTNTLEVSFGALAAPGRLPQVVSSNPPLFEAGAQQTLTLEQDAGEALFGTHGFRVAIRAGDAGPASFEQNQSLAQVQELSAPVEVPTEYYRVASNYALLLLGDPNIGPTLPDGGANPHYKPNRLVHLLAVPVLDPTADAGADSGTGDLDGGSASADGGT